MRRSILLAIAILPAIAPAAAFAQLGSTREERAACRPDALRLCRHHMPSPSAMRDCVLANKARLSAACRAVIERRT